MSRLWPFGNTGSSSTDSSNKSTLDSPHASDAASFRLPPTAGGGVMVPPPELPRSLRKQPQVAEKLAQGPFDGFSLPPPATVPPSSLSLFPTSSSSLQSAAKKETGNQEGLSTSLLTGLFKSNTTEKDYSGGDYSRYTSSVRESPGFDDDRLATFERDRGNSGWRLSETLFSTPRARNCLESVRMGMKMGCWVGGIFGGLAGAYTALLHRRLMLFPVSLVGGCVSFGFFLGCGMLVRCDTYPVPGYPPIVFHLHTVDTTSKTASLRKQ